MACINFSIGSTTDVSLAAETWIPTEISMSDLQNAAADIGAHDPLSSIRVETGLGRWFRRLFGIRRPSALADPKLEAIRRLAVAVRLGRDAQLSAETRAALASGLGPFQTRAVIARFSRAASA